MRWRWVVLGVALLALVGIPLLLASRLLNSEEGLRFALAQLQRIPSVRIDVFGANGTLAGPINIARLRIEHEAVIIEARDVLLDARVRSLLAGNVHLEVAQASDVEVVLKSREERPPEPLHFLPAFLEIVAPQVRLDRVALRLQNGDRYQVAAIRSALAMTRWRIDLTDLVIEDPAGRVDGALTLRATQPLGLRGSLNGRWVLPDERTWRFAAAVRGNLDRLGTTVTLAAPVNASFVGNTLALTEEPRAVGTLRLTDFDGSPWVETGRLPAVSGSIVVDATRDSFGLDGTLTSAVLGQEPLRLQGSGRWSQRTLELASLRAWLPRSSADLTTSGSITFAEGAPVLALAGDWSLLRWPIAGDTVVASPAGIYRLDGAMPYAFDVQAQARVPGLPEADFTATGTVDREQLVLGRLEGKAFDGRIAGSGRVSWLGDQPWSARLDAKQLDVTSIRPDLPGRVSLVATIDGRGFTPTAPWNAKLDSLSGSVGGRALTGRGEVSHRGGEYTLKSLRLANGTSHVMLDGRWGPRVDLRWSADLRSLSLVHPTLAGELVASGTLRGTPQRPDLVAEARGRRVQVAGVTIESFTSDVDADLSDARESHVDLRALSVSIGGMQLEEARLQAHGLARDHVAKLEVRALAPEAERAPAFRGYLAMAGGYDAESATWRGRLEQTSLKFPDATASLLQPAAFEFGRDGASADPVCLVTGEARLCVEGEWRTQPESWRVIYSAQDWPLKRLLRSLLGWREFDGRLQASGWAEQQPGRDWVGGTTAYIDDPVLDVRRNQFRTERIELGSGRLDVYAEPDRLRATVDVALTEGTRLAGEAAARREPGAGIAQLPISGVLRADAADLDGLPVLVPEIDRSGGRLEASVTVGGTVGSPRFNGEFHVRDGRLDLYRTNLSLTGLTLDGRFEGDELVFAGSGKAARGELTLDGRFEWPGDVMTGTMRLKGEQLMLADTPDFRIVASPDLVLTADADGYDVSGQVLIPLARIRPRDLSTTVSTSPDERIVGVNVEEEDEGPSTLDRVRSRVRVELGDDVRVDSFGLKATLAGAVTVITRPGDVVRGEGSIRVVEGEYKAFGQFVKIVRGVLSYKMTPLDDPTLDLVGQREIKAENIVVSLNVRGTLSNPFITLSSEPAMPEAEALSYLLTGRSINTLQSGEAASLDRAAQSLAIGGGGLLLGGLGTRVGLDEVSVEQTGDEDASVVLGKYLSPKLFVSYGISIAEAINTIKLRYTLNERWSLKAEAGLEQSADVEFKIER
jgi:translocation and assembly module TamB